jgi:hypothetical protein
MGGWMAEEAITILAIKHFSQAGMNDDSAAHQFLVRAGSTDGCRGERWAEKQRKQSVVRQCCGVQRTLRSQQAKMRCGIGVETMI